MEIAYLIQAYADVKAFKGLVKELLEMNNCEIFVHLDSKSNIDDFIINDERVHFIDKREFVSWAGYYQGKLIFNLIDAALKYNKKFDYYCFLSESDFPVLCGDKLIERLNNSKLKILDVSKYQPHKIEKYWFYDFHIKSVNLNKAINKTLNFISGIFYKIKILKKRKFVIIDGKECNVFMSSPFWCFDYETIKYVNDVYSRNEEFKKYFKTSFASCELMVSTIIANSKFINNCINVEEYINLNNLSDICYFSYTGPRVDVLTDKDYDDIIKSGKPFFRKAKSPNSDKLLKQIKEGWKKIETRS